MEEHDYDAALNSPSYHKSEEEEDLLTVFQAAPLVLLDSDGKEHPMKALDFEFERELLTKTFEESGGASNIRVDFEIATTDRLSMFLAEDQGRILHFSCHGHPLYLALEDGWGGLQTLGVDDLRKWITLGGKNLQFVFVSACHSSLIGQAFVDAGVQHVVCCRHDSQLREVAAGMF
jgi:hypothetical protein